MLHIRLSILGLLLSGLGAASTITVLNADQPTGFQQQVTINRDGVNHLQYWIGAIDVTVDGDPRRVWSTDLFSSTYTTTYNTVVGSADTPALQRMGWLLQNFSQGLLTQTQGAALQLAIWDIAHDNGDGFAPGSGRITQSTDPLNLTPAGVLTQASFYLAQSQGKAYPFVAVYHNTDSQGFPIEALIGTLANNGGALAQVPEPFDAAMVFGGLALIGIGARRRSRLQAAAGAQD